MPCYHPVEAWHGRQGGIVFNRHMAKHPVSFHIPCGQCIGCRLAKAREWSLRMVHESKMHKHNSFVTLTYEDSQLPMAGTLVPDHVRLFMKTLRKTKKARFYACGEYGENTKRPHYHVILFGVDFPDRRRFGGSDDKPQYVSAELTKIWSRGHCTTADVTPESCAYVAKYVVKKITGDQAEAHYTVNHHGQPYVRHAEFSRMSRMPGIGEAYFRQYGSELLEHDGVVINGKIVPPPGYYLRLAKKSLDVHKTVRDKRRANQKLFAAPWTGEAVVDQVKKTRVIKARSQRADNTPERLAVREQHTTKLMKKRTL